ncbi:unnamed protein product [Gongylonema pulchrum]|uniref:Protein kinase domain-containing protein n=1 Tax=Gongylonema pulchrum TaxID=637853 RepID=A0A183ENF3_9BILA|nr:unnamed protein product [Gongylonema pulchrum]
MLQLSIDFCGQKLLYLFGIMLLSLGTAIFPVRLQVGTGQVPPSRCRMSDTAPSVHDSPPASASRRTEVSSPAAVQSTLIDLEVGEGAYTNPIVGEPIL